MTTKKQNIAIVRDRKLLLVKALTIFMIILLIGGCNSPETHEDVWKEVSDGQSMAQESEISKDATFPNGQTDISTSNDQSNDSNTSTTSDSSNFGDISNNTSNTSEASLVDTSESNSSENSSNSDNSSDTSENDTQEQIPKKVLYLTFDDGPSKKNSEKILDILDKYDIKATFFIVGDSAKYHPEIIQKMYSEGHRIASHSMTHKLSEIYGSVENFEDDLDDWENTIKNILGELPEYKIYRFPGGSTAANRSGAGKNIFDLLEERGYYIYDWSAANCDKWLDQIRPDETIEEYLKRMLFETIDICQRSSNKPCIVLMHETSDESVEMLDWALEKLTKEGYTFDTLDNLNSSYTFVNYS